MKFFIFVLVILITNFGTTWSTISKSVDDVHFYLFPDKTDVNKNQEIVYGDTESLENSKFVKNKLIRIFAHGFLGNLTSEASGCPQIKGAFLLRGYSNIMCVDWSKLAGPDPNIIPGGNPLADIFYPIAQKNTITVGNRVGDFVIFLIKNGIASSTDSFQLLGHSLGAHLMGIAGRRVYTRTGKKVGWITGLDPAGPLYETVPDRYSLSKNSAKFVDTLHTDADLFGTRKPRGTVAFYANGGRGSDQPGCPPLDLTALTDSQKLFCAHITGFTYYQRAILGENLRGCKCHLSFIIKLTPACGKPEICIETVQLGPLVSHAAKGNYFVAIPKNAPKRIRKKQTQLLLAS